MTLNVAGLLATIPARFSAEPRTAFVPGSESNIPVTRSGVPQSGRPFSRTKKIPFEAIETNMGMKRDNLEWQLGRASTELSTFEKELDQGGVAAEARPKNAKWRNLNGRCRQLRRRLIAVSKVEATNIEVAQRKESASAEVASAS